MAAPRPFAPSPRRRALAHRAGLHAASRLVTGAAAAAAGIAAVTGLAAAAATRLGHAVVAACAAAAGPDRADALAPGAAAALPQAVLAIAGPLLAAAGIAALIAHLAQTRAGWLPRRRIAGAPAAPRPSLVRELAAPAAIGGVAVGWLWAIAPRLAALPAAPSLAPAGLLLTAALAALAAGWVAVAAVDAVARQLALGEALRMTAAEKREDDRLAGPDPRFRAQRRRLAGGTLAEAVAAASVLVLGDGIAVAVAWDPVRLPRPQPTAIGRGPRASQLLALARRHRIPVHREPTLASALARGAADHPVAEPLWPRLAEVIAAVRTA